jgi:Domain of Kin17 curved DNA-binding protein
VRFLGREGFAVVIREEAAGVAVWFITYIDKSANALERQRMEERKLREEAQQKRDEKELERLRATAPPKVEFTPLLKSAAPVKLDIKGVSKKTKLSAVKKGNAFKSK